ncbi:MAG: alpha/beta fold hydrolase [Anaeromyxobacteraceae bacterium]|nr:alpha/beta fold hydrolase [Anaeromyxobacteraceae bacterium]
MTSPVVAAEAPLRHVQVGEHRLAYRRAGEGEPVLLVHGITTSSFLWEGVMARLSASGRHDLVAVDLLGCGESDKPLQASYSIKAHADLLGRFASALGLGRLHVVGHDLGGGVAQIMAVRQPGLLRSLAVVNTVGYDFWPVQPITALRTPVVREIMMAALDAGAFTMLVRRGLFHKALATPALMARYLAPLRTAEGRKAFVHFARCLDNANLMEIAPDLRRLRIPALIVWGLADTYLSSAIADRLAADIPGARLERLAEAGHFSPIDAPDRLAALLQDHLDAARG